MYNPAHFAISDIAAVHAFIRSNPFATLAANIGGEIHFAYVPVIVESESAPLGTAHFHFARANPMANIADGATIKLAMLGAHAYVSPNWYETPDQVPTWNYTAVEGSGKVKRLAGPETLRYLERLAAEQEAVLAPNQPWTPRKVNPERLKNLLSAIVGFQLAFDCLEGKAKLSQNKSQADIAGVIAALKDRGDPAGIAVAASMQKLSLA
jgi:transcriptional regulator